MTTTAQPVHIDQFRPPLVKNRICVEDVNPSVLTKIYDERPNITIWQRELPDVLKQAANSVMILPRGFELSMTVSPESAGVSVARELGLSDASILCDDIDQLVEMYCCLLDVSRVGLRLRVLDKAMCPRFHVDNVPCRLITTYQGVATEWLPHDKVDRSKLGRGNNGLPDNESGIYSHPDHIKRLSAGHVALLKGELWEGNDGAGLVHRSPTVEEGERRLMLTLDIVD